MVFSWQAEGDYEGIVQHIKMNCPVPEREEIFALLGNKLIHANQNLWTEFKALKSIINETVDKSTSIVSKVEVKQKSIGKRSIANAINFSSTHYSNEDEQSVHKINKFSLEIVANMIVRIQSSIESENIELESEVARLNSELMTQSDSVFLFPETGKETKIVGRQGIVPSLNNNQCPSDSSNSGVSSPRAGVESARNGRFRSRLNSVRDELFFLDDF